MLKINEATELCITNGAERTVVGWQSQLISLKKSPLKDVHVPGLPTNIVPIMYSSKQICCTLSDDSIVRILQKQVMSLLNFAMTDFGVQGHTQLANVIDLQYCKGHQSMYTCLSQSSSYYGALILSKFNWSKVTNGLHTNLLRELQKLKILDNITRLRVEGLLPSVIFGSTRADLIGTDYNYYGYNYIPGSVHESLS
ncbi:uncharacterized protein PHACADRAFT_163458 [Phanerochaete carnosa HHB-10118-sp]|uniref:Uncharacterized protein n=1 Tax=Phanerochaete carnosa (strain HHB-10118-sp) TaxID=650164 RepID=K5VNX4_PHACS|nr:uncharacterized protein PHACADRAFT_163458 [Phanerochaete carnosa HHB-10118-sp]EKM53173.1 hypothetical protein PHACADRAFT_163458 [Phanerochaete carnosa HHB-10118-sp]